MTHFSSGEQRCSFCQRPRHEVDHLIAGPEGVFICNHCVQLSLQLLEQEVPEFEEDAEFAIEHVPSPREIYEYLNEYVIGQERAKRVLSVAVHNHYKRVAAGGRIEDVEIEKSNILLIGPTGCGKTLLAQTLARVLDVPFSIADATALTEAGYVGEDVENILLRLIQAADWDIKRAEKGIIYIDEIDKIARKGGDNPSITRDVSGEGVQQALLKIIEGTVANIPPQGGRKHPHQEFIQMDTSNILFICGGMFDGVEDLVADRIGVKGSLGFQGHSREAASQTNLLRNITTDDLVHYGLIPELVGRIPVVTYVEPLDVDALMRILVEPRNALTRQYQQLLGVDDVKLVFTEDGLQAAAEAAIKREIGARGLRGIIEQVLLDVMFEIPGRPDIRQVIVNREVIEGRTYPIILTEDDQPLQWSDDGSLESAA
ncbi:MAG: ATP-dependent Clp protease ATP-binding subunit ClpX [Anaerolineae bacterium]|nr:ATP-dependent Clp protease ATP-binding subunit ClpX [Anaerolineae bacterium]